MAAEFAFATCERERALTFLQQLYPNGNVTADSAREMLDLVEADIIRILDPNCHRGGAIQSSKWDDVKADEYTRIMREFNARHLPDNLKEFAGKQEWEVK